jgi:hypothetical protein
VVRPYSRRIVSALSASCGTLFPAAGLCAAAALLPQIGRAQVALSWQGGVLGSQVEYSIQAAPGTFFALLPSFSGGPTPLSIFDPNDPRVLNIGLDLQPLWRFGSIRGLGAKQVLYPLPLSGTLAGLTLNAQAVTFPGSTTLVKDISNAVKFALTFTNQTVPTQNESGFARMFHSCTTLPDGRIYVAGGQAPGPAALIYDRVEFFDPQTQSFGLSPIALPEPRTHHTATLLLDGNVLLLGGIGNGGVLASGRIFQPASGTYKSIPNMSAPRAMQTATLLADGRVFVAGGSPQFTFSHPIGFPTSFTSALPTSEIYDPVSNTWTSGPSLPKGLTTHQASLLGDGRVLLTGGVENSPTPGVVPLTTAATYLYTPGPGGGALQNGPPLPGARQHQAQTPIEDGGALVVGGALVDFTAGTTVVSSDAYRYSLTTGAWTVVSCTIIVRCGRIICVPRPGQPPGYGVMGGLSSMDLITGLGVPQTQIGVFNPLTNVISVAGSELKPRMGTDIAAFDNGKRILILGTAGGVPADKTADIFTLHP